jgi:hypothetical protein
MEYGSLLPLSSAELARRTLRPGDPRPASWPWKSGSKLPHSKALLSGILPADGVKHEVGKSPDKCGRVIQASGHVKLLDAQTLGDLAGFDIDFVQSFDVVGDEGNRHHEDSLASS